jgi:hypothetical protein
MPSSPSHASIFFEKIVGLGPGAFSYLDSLAKKSAQTDENEWREFKGGGFISAPTNAAGPQKDKMDPDRRVKAIWSECLGAFANSSGGILIWGIKAPNKMAEGTDLVTDAKSLEDRLRVLSNDAVDPPILGIEVRAIISKATPNGFVICYVPASDFSPHRSKWADREYYLRAQDGNRPIPTAILRRMFYPRTLPLVVPLATAAAVLGSDEFLHLQMRVDLKNRGMASAEDIAIQFTPINQQCQTFYDSNRWSREEWGGGFNFRGNITIHPDETIRWLNNCTSDLRDWTEEGRTLVFRYRIFARNVPALDFELSFTAAELTAPSQLGQTIEREAALVST